MTGNNYALTGALAWCALLTAITALPAAQAQTRAAPSISVGERVIDPAGQDVGTIKATDGDTAVVWTGSMKVTVGVSSFRHTANGLRIGMNRQQLESAATTVQAKGDDEVRSRLLPGAEVQGSDGAVIGSVEAIDGATVTLMAGTAKVQLPVAAFSRSGDALRIAMTGAELDAAVKAQTPPPPPPADPAPGNPKPPADEPQRE